MSTKRFFCALVALVAFLVVPAQGQEKLSASNTSRFVGNGRWDWTVFLQASPPVLGRIKCVEYTLHPTFPNPVRRVCTRGGNAQPFALSSNGWGTFTIGIKAYFADGKTQALQYDLVFDTTNAEQPACKTQ